MQACHHLHPQSHHQHRRTESSSQFLKASWETRQLQIDQDDVEDLSLIEACDDYDNDDDINDVGEIEQAVLDMDAICQASFGAWVRDWRNWPQARPHLQRLAAAEPYAPDCVASALFYVSRDWPLEAVARVLEDFGWLPALLLRHLYHPVNDSPSTTNQRRQVGLVDLLVMHMPLSAWQALLSPWDFTQASDLLRGARDRSRARDILQAVFATLPILHEGQAMHCGQLRRPATPAVHS
jgi:hypothetical protein